MTALYNDPIGGTASSIGPQMRTDYWNKKALIEIQKEQYFSQLADVTGMPKHFGKKIKQYHYLPLLDDLNVNSQGLDASGVSYDNGNMYGSSKDVGTIVGKLPLISETGGRVNRVGYTRVTIEATLEKLGFFDEYAADSMNFDTDAELEMHQRSEMLKAANEITEDMLQADLLTGAGTIRFGGIATEDAEMTGEGSDISVIDYEDLMRLSIDLDNNRTPKATSIITGSRLIDTATIDAGRILYVGTEMLPTLKKMTDPFGNQAFIPVQKYASSGQTVRGEAGTIDQFRIVVVPEMQHWEGEGATEVVNEGYRATSGKYDIYPLLCIGSGSFTTVGFQTDGKTVKFKIIRKKPGEATADRTDPYGELGFNSIKWFYAAMLLRPERIALAKSVAEM